MMDRGVTTSLSATFFEGLLIRQEHPNVDDLSGTFSFILSILWVLYSSLSL